MRYQLFHLYGPFAIHSYGLCIALALLIFTILIQRHPVFKKLQLQNSFFSIATVGIITGIAGGRVLHIITETDDLFNYRYWFSWWEGGYSILGTILALFFVLPLYLKHVKVPVIPFFDLVAVYAPLLQAISRVGCFFAGCCHGIPTDVVWAVQYTDPLSMAPQYIFMHPTQLYSAAALMSMFLFLFYYLQHKVRYTGQLVSVYLILEGTERFIIDFWRAQRPMMGTLFSADQCVAAGIILLGWTMLWYSMYWKKQQTLFYLSNE